MDISDGNLNNSKKHLSLVDQSKQNNRQIIESIKNSNNLIEVAKDLGGIDHKKISGDKYLGPCPTGHSSVSNKCFSMNNLLYHCFNCGIGGDVIRYVQEVKFKVVNTETFHLALDYLAGRAGLSYSTESRIICAKDYENTNMALKILNVAANYYEGQLTSEEFGTLKYKYGFTEETIKHFQIGFSTGNGLLKHLLSLGFSHDQALLSGLFIKTHNGMIEFFNNRIVFPYKKQNQVTYFIGRKTDKTPNNEYELGKYKKLLTYNEEKRSYIASGVQNDTIFNQDVIFKATDVIITEGITDCIALHQNGFSAISPVTVRFRNEDSELLSKILRKDQTIYLCNDNEYNDAGKNGAFDTALNLSKKGFTVKIITIPIEEKQRYAREKLDALRK